MSHHSNLTVETDFKRIIVVSDSIAWLYDEPRGPIGRVRPIERLGRNVLMMIWRDLSLNPQDAMHREWWRLMVWLSVQPIQLT